MANNDVNLSLMDGDIMMDEHIKNIKELINSAKLPKMEAILSESKEIASSIVIGRSRFMEKYGVSSELEYKRMSIKNGHVMFHAHIGMNTWDETARSLRAAYDFAESNGFVIDRGRDLP